MSTQIAFVGCSHIHVQGFTNMVKQVQGITVKYAWDPEIERAQKWGAQVGAEVVTDLKVIAKDPDIKAVVITSKTVEHAELVKMFAKAGKDMFVEKPLGMSAEDAAQFLAQAGLQLADVADSGEQVIINSAGLENAAELVKVSLSQNLGQIKTNFYFDAR